MKKLTSKEVEWLEVFSRNNDFFESILRNYYKHDAISYDYYGFLIQHINDVEKNGDTLLIVEESQFLEDNAEDFKEINKIFVNYNKNGYLNEHEYNDFLNFKFSFPEKKKELATRKLQASMELKMKSLQAENKNKLIQTLKDVDLPHSDFSTIFGKISKTGAITFSSTSSNKINIYFNYKYDGFRLVIKYFFEEKMNDVKLANDIFFDNKTVEFYCDCGTNFPDPKSLFNHIFKTPQCLISYLPELRKGLEHIGSKQPKFPSISKLEGQNNGKIDNFTINLTPDLSAMPLRKEETSKQTLNEDDEDLFV